MTEIVYCLENPSMPDVVKIGRTQDLEQRLKTLDTTGVPLPFICVAAMEVDDAAETEQLLHDVFSDQRVRSNREFFEVSPERVAAALRLTRGRDVTPISDAVEDDESQAALDKARKKRAAFNFDMVGISAGSELRFHYSDITNEGEPFTAVVVSRNRISFEGEDTSLSAAAGTILQRNGRGSWTPQGPRYWYFGGESLAERRRRMEEEGAE